MIDEINSLIESISEKINTGACDYSMSMPLFQCQVSEGPVETIIQSAFSKWVHTRDLEPSTAQQLLDDVNYAATQTEYGGPLPYMNTKSNKNDARLIKKAFGNFLYSGEKIYRFHLTGNHPFCPIIWEFAYCIIFPSHSVVLVASASD